MTKMSTALNEVLHYANLPKEGQIIGRHFAFEFVDDERAVNRISGTILGFECEHIGSNISPDTLTVHCITTPIRPKKLSDPTPPMLTMSLKSDKTVQFGLIFWAYRENGSPDINGHKMYQGKFYLI